MCHMKTLFCISLPLNYNNNNIIYDQIYASNVDMFNSLGLVFGSGEKFIFRHFLYMLREAHRE